MLKNSIYLILLFSPLPFGSARPVWQLAWMVLFLTALSLDSLLISFKSNGQPQSWRKILGFLPEPFLIGTFALLGIGILQIVPGLSSAVSSFSTLSASPVASLEMIVQLCTYILFFLTALRIFSSHSHRLAAQNIILHVITLYAAYGLIAYFSGNGWVLWYPKWAAPHSLTATFGNRNHFATYCGLGLLLSAARLLEILKDTRPQTFLSDILTGSTLILLAEILILLDALILTNSRGGIFSIVLGLGVLFSPYTRLVLASRKKLLIGGGFLVLSMVLLFELSGHRLSERLSDPLRDEGRLKLYPNVVELIAQKPLLGHGLASFETVFPAVRHSDVSAYYRRAHNDYLELMVGAGIPVSLLFFYGVFLLPAGLLKRARQNEYRPATMVGMATFTMLAFHSLMDFPLQVPAVTYTAIAIFASSYDIVWKKGANDT